MSEKIKLGDKVRDKVTGYTGIAVARTQYLNGCTQYSVARKLKKGESIPIEGDPSIDERVLEVIQKKAIVSKEYELEEQKEKKKEHYHTGGATRIMPRMRGY